MTNAKSPLLELDKISKHYGDFIANEQIDLELFPGEIHALLGENGAGKSTLVKTLYGVHQPTSGVIKWRGETIKIQSPNHARSIGISMIFQHFSLFDSLNVAENISLGIDSEQHRQNLINDIDELSERYQLKIDPKASVLKLSTGERQRVEIIRALLQEPTLLIMDEPTSVLTPQEIEALFVTLDKFRADGKTILYISHKLGEVKQLCDHATILRQAKVVATCLPAQQSQRSMAEMMIGGELSETHKKTTNAHSGEQTSEQAGERAGNQPILQINQLNYQQQDGIALDNINLQVHPGEILGIAGVAGNGQNQLAEIIAGELRSSAGSVVFAGQAIGALGVRQRRALGINSVPAERIGKGAVVEMSLAENTLLTGYQAFGLVNKLGVINSKRCAQSAKRIVSEFKVYTPALNAKAGNLSGGNLQKQIVGREIQQQPRLLVIYNPTWGLDAGAIYFIRQALLDLAASGSAIMLISQDLDEIFELSDSIAVMFAGALSRSYPAGELNHEQVGLLMGGASLD